MSEHPDRPAFDPGAGSAPASWPDPASDPRSGVPTAALPAYPPAAGWVVAWRVIGAGVNLSFSSAADGA